VACAHQGPSVFPGLSKLPGQPIPAFGLAVKRVIDLVVASVWAYPSRGASAGFAAALDLGLDSWAGCFPRCAWERKGKFRCHKLAEMSTMPMRIRTIAQGKRAERAVFQMENDPRVTRCGRCAEEIQHR